MAKDSLPLRRHKSAIIHEPKKGLLPQKSCLKRSSDSSLSDSDGSSVSADWTSNADEVGASLDGYSYNNEPQRLIRDDTDYPRAGRQEQVLIQGRDLDAAQQYNQSEASCGAAKRKVTEIDTTEEKDTPKRNKAERKLSKAEIQRIVRDKVREANRAIALEELAARTSFQQMQSTRSDTSWLDFSN